MCHKYLSSKDIIAKNSQAIINIPKVVRLVIEHHV